METMTLFESCSSKQSREVTWQEMYELIRGNALRAKTEALRQMMVGYDALTADQRKQRDKEIKRIKATWFPGLLPAVHCKDGVRRLTEVTDYTGFCHVDFDHLTDEQVVDIKARLREVPEVLLLHTSMRGQGLHVYYRLEPAPNSEKRLSGKSYQDTYIQGFRQGNAYFAGIAGVPYDSKLEPPVHLSCPCHDADVYFNPEAKAFVINPDIILDQEGKECAQDRVGKKARKRGRRKDDGVTKVEQIAAFIKGKELRWDVLSRKVQARDGDGGIWTELSERGMNDLFIECCQAVGRNLSFQDFKHVLNSGVVPEVNPLREYISGLPAWDGEDYIGSVAGRVRVEERESEELRVMRTIHNSQFIIHNSLNEVDNENELRIKNEELRMKRTIHNSQFIIHNSSNDNRRTKDEELSCESLWSHSFRKWFCAMVASWMRDDVVNHQVLVLIGEQGIFKTSWLDALMPPALAQYRCRQNGARALDKDEQLRATEFGLINMDEIDRMSEQELNALKSLITASDITVRAAYAQTKERRLRVASYVASGNKEQFLTDTTGNRRWLPFKVLGIESPFEHPLPYEGMYAQAWALVQQGFNYWFSLEDIHAVAAHVEGFSVESNEEQLLPVYFSPCQPGTNGAQLLTVAEISAKLTLYGNIRKPLDVRRLGALLKRMGYVRGRNGRTGPRGYIVLENTAEAINAQRRMSALSAEPEVERAPHEPQEPMPF